MKTIFKIAVLLTCHNRKVGTLQCLKALYAQYGLNVNFKIEVFLVDDGSTDGTANEVKTKYPLINLIQGNGNLFWAGGMRESWGTAVRRDTRFDYFLLLNDDTVLYDHTIEDLLKDYSNLNTKDAMLTAATTDSLIQNISYGGSKLLRKGFSQFALLNPNNSHPQLCNLANANILLVPFSVYEKIGILSDQYTHGLADFDYSLKAGKNKIPVYLASKIGGVCDNEHGNNWRSSGQYTLKERIAYLYSPKGLAYKEYLYYIKEHFPSELPIAFFKLWMKTLFPSVWDKLKS